MRHKQPLFFLIGIGIAISVMVVFTFFQTIREREVLVDDLKYRTGLLADSLKESVEPTYIGSSTSTLQKLVDKFTNRERLVGLAVYDNKGSLIARSVDLSSEIVNKSETVSAAMDSDSSIGNMIRFKGQSLYIFAQPLHYQDRVVGAFSVVQNAGYINDAIGKIWKNNFFRSLAQILLFFIVIVAFIWWLVYKPLKNIVESVKSVRVGAGGDQSLQKVKGFTFFRPLVNEISKITTSLFEARRSASEEARMRLEKLDTPWTAERLKEFIKAHLRGQKIFLVSNREPYVHNKVKNEIEWSMPAGGIVTALDPVMRACGGMWIAHGSGNFDKETADEKGKLSVPPDDPKYTLKRIWLSEDEIKGHYVGFSNEALWPLCLMTHVRPIFSKENWERYKEVNQKFADSLLDEIKDIERPLVLIQDYHFALLSRMIKTKRPDAEICLFWHIPWPNAENFSICPWRKEILLGMLGADVIGFNTQQFCNNFIDTVGKELESLVDLEQFSVTRAAHISHIRSFPISVAFTKDQSVEEFAPLDKAVLERLNIKTTHLGLGVDRLDYTKGIPERFKAVEFFLDVHPEYRGAFTFLQIASPTREEVLKYQEHREAVIKEAERINKKFGTNEWKPIVLEVVQYSHPELESLYKLADMCLVTSLHDSMNLVAKEFAAARSDEAGVLVLSQFAGASRDMKGALIVNPYNTEEVAAAMYKALTMPRSEQRERMKKMRERVKNYNVYRWAADLISEMAHSHSIVAGGLDEIS